MRALTVTAVVGPDHTLTVQVPADIPPGIRTAVVVLEDAAETSPRPTTLTFHPHPVGPADPACTYRREDMYGDDGR
jgi:hypothetical protein